MHPALRQLLILQERDQKILSATKNLEKVPREQADEKRKLDDDAASLVKAHDFLKQSELSVKKVELDVTTRRNTISRLKQQQFETRKNEEFTALGNEVKRYEKEIDALETQELELMEQVDEAREKLRIIEEKHGKLKLIYAEAMKDLIAKEKNLKAMKAELEAERAVICVNVDADVLPLYEKLMKSKGGQAVVQVENGLCGGCHMKLVPSTLVKVIASKEIAQCENCGRILYPE